MIRDPDTTARGGVHGAIKISFAPSEKRVEPGDIEVLQVEGSSRVDAA
jgi:hypothetical protein